MIQLREPASITPPAPMPAAPRPSPKRKRPIRYGGIEGNAPTRRYLAGFVLAVGLHLGILYGIPGQSGPYTPPEFGVVVDTAGVEVTLVAAMPAETVDETAPETPPEAITEPEPPVEETPVEETPPVEEPEPEPEPVLTPEPEPEPEATPEATPEVVVAQPTPAPPKPAATPTAPPKAKATPRPAKPKPPTPRRAHAARYSGDGSSAIPGRDATTAVAGGGAVSSQPGYLRNPHPSYPEEARRAGQEGVVNLRVSIDERGNVTGVAITRSSGFPLLDERARSVVAQRWRFRPARRGKEAVATTVVVPIRFSLK